MLRHLREHSPLPVPAVHLSDDRLLVMDFVDGTSGLSAAAQAHAAELLADLHGRPVARYGFPQDTLIGPLAQPNPESDDWVAFFRDHRLLHMAQAAHHEGELGAGLLGRIERLAGRLGDLIGQPAPPALIHGDLWGGNVLVKGDRIAGLIDPAIYHADPEIELAFSTLFSTFGEPFFRRYQEIRPLRPGFFEVRRDIYNLYPLLVHVRVFGGSYLGAVDRIVRRIVG
jgi:fructosamine-3-kinase